MFYSWLDTFNVYIFCEAPSVRFCEGLPIAAITKLVPVIFGIESANIFVLFKNAKFVGVWLFKKLYLFIRMHYKRWMTAFVQAVARLWDLW